MQWILSILEYLIPVFNHLFRVIRIKATVWARAPSSVSSHARTALAHRFPQGTVLDPGKVPVLYTCNCGIPGF